MHSGGHRKGRGQLVKIEKQNLKVLTYHCIKNQESG